MRQWGRIFLLCLALCWSAVAAQAQQIQLDVLTINDFHGALAAEDKRFCTVIRKTG